MTPFPTTDDADSMLSLAGIPQVLAAGHGRTQEVSLPTISYSEAYVHDPESHAIIHNASSSEPLCNISESL